MIGYSCRNQALSLGTRLLAGQHDLRLYVASEFGQQHRGRVAVCVAQRGFLQPDNALDSSRRIESGALAKLLGGPGGRNDNADRWPRIASDLEGGATGSAEAGRLDADKNDHGASLAAANAVTRAARSLSASLDEAKAAGLPSRLRS